MERNEKYFRKRQRMIRSGLHSKMIAFIALWRMYRSEPRTDAE